MVELLNLLKLLPLLELFPILYPAFDSSLNLLKVGLLRLIDLLPFGRTFEHIMFSFGFFNCAWMGRDFRLQLFNDFDACSGHGDLGRSSSVGLL